MYLKKALKCWQNVYICVYFLVLSVPTLFIFQNCSKYQANYLGKRKVSSHTINCKVQLHTITPFERNKVQISQAGQASLESYGEDDSGTQQTLAMVVNPSCLSQAEEPVEVLGQIVEVPSQLSQLNSAAINMTFDGEIDMDQLTRDMEQSPCLIGITEDETVTLEPGYTEFTDDNEDPIPGVQADSASTNFNDPMITDQGHLDFINYFNSLDLQNQITGTVVVAVVDSGIDKNHPDFQNRLWDDGYGNPGKNFVSGGNPNDTDDELGHGTHVAGIIAARQNNNTGTVGLNGDFVRIMVAKTFKGKTTTTSAIYNGIQYAIEQEADVINLSLSTSTTKILYLQAINEAINAGIIVSMAAGNNGKQYTNQPAARSYYCPAPGCFGYLMDGALSVASVNSSTGNLSSFSDFGAVDIAAPGSELDLTRGILSTIPGNQWGRMAGTSMATPVISAAAAFLIGHLKTNNINYTPSSIETFLKEKGTIVSSHVNVIEGRIIDFDVMSENIAQIRRVISCGPGFRPNSDQTACIPATDNNGPCL